MKHWLFIYLLAVFLVTLPGFSGAIDPAESQEWESKSGIRFVWIPAGEFMMGSPVSESERERDEHQHRVTLAKGYWLGKYEVTQGEWQEVMGTNPSRFSNCGRNCPVERVSWNEVQEFIRRLNQQDSANRYRLPTEAEWEYAARAGSQTAYSFGNDPGDLENYGWHDDNSGDRTHPVGQKSPNGWGLYDMHGNVWEWTADWHGKNYPGGSVTDPAGPSSGSFRVIRGGGWYDYARHCRSAFSSCLGPDRRGGDFGFRLLRNPR